MAKYMILLAVLMAVVAVTHAVDNCIVCLDSEPTCKDKVDPGTPCEDADKAACKTSTTYAANDDVTKVARSCAATCEASDSRGDAKGAGDVVECCTDADNCNKAAPKEGEGGGAAVLKCVVCDDDDACLKKTETTDCAAPNNKNCKSVLNYDADNKITLASRSCGDVCAEADTRPDKTGVGMETKCCSENGCNKGEENGATSVVLSSVLIMASLLTALKQFF